METITLQDAILAVADAVRDVVEGTTTANVVTTNKMQDATKVGGKDKMWQGSEVLLLEPDAASAGLVGSNVFEVTDFNSNDGTFTLNRNFSSSTGVPANVRYVLLRNRGQGVPYRSYLRAIRYALDKMDTSVEVTNKTIVTVADTFTYTIPSGMDVLYDVVFDHATLGHYNLRPDWWDLEVGRKLVLTNRNISVENGWTIWLYGTLSTSLPTTLTGTMLVSFEELTNQAEEYLRRTSPRAAEATRAGNLTQERVRTTQIHIHPNSKEIF